MHEAVEFPSIMLHLAWSLGHIDIKKCNNAISIISSTLKLCNELQSYNNYKKNGLLFLVSPCMFVD